MSRIPSYVAQRLSDAACAAFTARLNSARISGPLRIVPEPSQSKGFRASGLSACLRQTGYRLQGVPQTNDTYNPDNQLAADQGTAIHVRIQEQAIGAGMVLRHEQYPQDRRGYAIELSLRDVCAPELRETISAWGFSGHIDAVLQDNSGDLAILDVKTAKPDLLDPGYPYLAEKLQSYATQTMSYMACFAAPDGRRAHTTYIYMISRGHTKDRALYRIPWQPERWQVDAGRLERASFLTGSGELPDPEPERGGCRFCAWRGICPAGGGH